MEQAKYDVFISYSRKDYLDERNNVIPNSEVSKILEALDVADISYWIDKEGIDWGAEFPEVISSGIESSTIIVFISSKNSIVSKWVTKEIALADSLNKHIIPVRLDNTSYNINNKLALRVIDLNSLNYYKNSTKAINDLISFINNYLEEKRREEEIKLQEEEKQKEIEKKKRDELETRLKEQQKQLILEIESSCNNLNQKETTIESEREKLLLAVDDRITDKSEQERIKSLITSTSPIRRIYNKELQSLHNRKNELNNICENLKFEIKKKDSEIRELKQQVECEISTSQSHDYKDYRISIVWIPVLILLFPLIFTIIKVTKCSSDEAGINTEIIDKTIRGLLDTTAQVKCYYNGFKEGDSIATFQLGKCFETGEYLDRNANLRTANYLVHKAASQGYPEAQTTLGNYFYYGLGCWTDYDSATYWYKEAIKKGSASAKYYLAVAYDQGKYRGREITKEDSLMAVRLYEESANEGSALSMFCLGKLNYSSKKTLVAKRWFEKALESGLPPYEESVAQFYLGYMYDVNTHPMHGVDKDLQKALVWYEKSATNGDGYPYAMYHLGECFVKDEKNIDKAIEWYQKAANRGHKKSKEILKKIVLNKKR